MREYGYTLNQLMEESTELLELEAIVTEGGVYE